MTNQVPGPTDEPKIIVATMFDQYRRLVIPRDAGPTQVEECRRAFFAGAICLLGFIQGKLSQGDEVTDSDLKLMENLDAELQDFQRELDAYVVGKPQ